MTDEAEQFILADSVSAAAEEPPGRRGIFRRRRRSKLHTPPLTHCENCGAPLTGEFCAKCGQHAIDYRRSLFRVLIDAADSFFNWDTKFLKSLGLLLVKPWKLTNDFNAGRRMRYVHPLRLYLLASIAFFLIARLLNFNGNAIQFDAHDRVEIESALAKLAAPDSGLDDVERAKVEEARAKLAQVDEKLAGADRGRMQSAFGTLIAASVKQKLKEKDHTKLNKALDRFNAVDLSASPSPSAAPGAESSPPATVEASPGVTPSASPSPSRKERDGIHFSDKPDAEKKAFERWLETRIKDKIGEDGTKSKLFLETIRSNIPAMMLCCIPLFAFVLKILYFRKRRFYVEHLVYALHIHTFLYMSVIVTALLAMGANRWVPGLSGLIIGVLSCAIFVQIFLSIRRVYGQGWFFSAFKFWLGGIVYFVILVLGVGITAFITLLLP